MEKTPKSRRGWFILAGMFATIALATLPAPPPPMSWRALGIQGPVSASIHERGWMAKDDSLTPTGPPRDELVRAYVRHGRFAPFVEQVRAQAIERGLKSEHHFFDGAGIEFVGDGWSIKVVQNMNFATTRFDDKLFDIWTSQSWDISPAAKARRLIRSWRK